MDFLLAAKNIFDHHQEDSKDTEEQLDKLFEEIMQKISRAIDIGDDLMLKNIKIDHIATTLIPKNLYDTYIALRSPVDGNCLYYSCSILLVGSTEELPHALRAAVSIELYKHSDYYKAHPYLLEKIKGQPDRKDIINSMCMSFEATNSQDCVQAEAKRNLQNRSWASLMTMLGLSSVINREIVSVYPETGDLYSKVFNGLISPRNPIATTQPQLHILWSRVGDIESKSGSFTPNHFAPLIKKTKLSNCSQREEKVTGPPTKKRCLEERNDDRTATQKVPQTKGTLRMWLGPQIKSKIERKESSTVQSQCVQQKSCKDDKTIDIADIFNMRDSLTPEEKVTLKEKIWKPSSDFSFPKQGPKNLSCRFDWLRKYKMLMYSKSKDAVYCLPCVVMGCQTQSHLTKESGLRNWNNALKKFQSHFNEKHSSAEDLNNLSLAIRNPNRSIDVTVNKLMSNTIMKNREMIRPIIETLICLGKNNIAIRGHRDDSKYWSGESSGNHCGNFVSILKLVLQFAPPHLKSLVNKCPANATYKSKNIQNEIIDILREYIQFKIVKKIKQTKYFAVLADEASDISNKEQMSLVIRYLDSTKQIKEEFLSFIYCKDGTSGDAISKYIISEVEKLGLDFGNVRGQGYDGAGAMAGKEKGVASRIMKDYPAASYIHCFSHRLNLSVMKVINVDYVSDVFQHTRCISDFFNNSPKRSDFLMTIFEESKSDGKKLINICRTRWVQRILGLERIISSYCQVHTALSRIAEGGEFHGVRWDSSSQNMASGLQSKMENFTFLCSLVIVKEIFAYFAAITTSLQESTLSIVESFQHISNVIETIEGVRLNIDHHHQIWFQKAVELGKEIGIEPKTPRIIGRSINRDNTPADTVEEYFKRSVSINCLNEVLVDLKSRFDSNSIAVIDGFYAIPSIMAVKPNWKKQLKEFITKFIDDMPDYENVDAEINLWGNFWLNNKSESLPSTVEDTLQKMLTTVYPNIHKVLHLVAVLPVTTCTCERSISTLRRVKNYLRNSMSQDRLIGLVLLHIHKHMEIDIDEIIDRFASKHPRRLQMVNLLEDD